MFQSILFISQLESAPKSLIVILVANLTSDLDQLLVKVDKIQYCFFSAITVQIGMAEKISLIDILTAVYQSLDTFTILIPKAW